MNCPRCGSANSDSARFCERCGGALGQPSDQTIMPQQAMSAPPRSLMSGRNVVLIVIVLAVVLVVVIAAVAMLMLGGSGTDLEITSYTHTSSTYTFMVLFNVNVTNTGTHTESGTVHCMVKFGNGDSYSASQAVTLDAGQSQSYYVAVMTSFMHMSDSTGTYSCKF